MAKKKQAIEAAEPERNLGGRPPKWDEKFIGIAAKAAAMGMTYIEIADMLDVSESSFRRWLRDHPELRKAISISLEAADERVGLSLFQMAVGYERSEEEVRFINGVETRYKIKRYYPPSPQVALRWAEQRLGWWADAAPSVPKDDGQEVEGTNLSIRDVARRVALLMHMGAKGTTQ
jgi:transcriptional regulator with XRE-family HTH domain